VYRTRNNSISLEITRSISAKEEIKYMCVCVCITLKRLVGLKKRAKQHQLLLTFIKKEEIKYCSRIRVQEHRKIALFL
jgi:hypothetical protein